MPTIAAILFMVAFNMSEYKKFIKCIKTAPVSEWFVMVVTFALTVIFDLVVAIAVGLALAGVFFLQYTTEIFDNFKVLGVAATLLILCAMLCSSLLSRVGGFSNAVRRTIVIEVGMQNAAQAIAIASSPFIFNSGEMAIPAIIYALLMNVILLIYVAVIRNKKDGASK